MYEKMTYSNILNPMLDRVPLDIVDKREGSIIYDAIAPAAAELAQLYINNVIVAVLAVWVSLRLNCSG